MNLSRIFGATQALAINAVSIGGVFGLGWPVGTAIALYWAENVLRGVLVLILLIAWRFSRASGRDDTAHVFQNFTIRKFLGFGLAFKAVHAVFLVVILGFVVPRMAPAQRFQAGSFREGYCSLRRSWRLCRLCGRSSGDGLRLWACSGARVSMCTVLWS